MRMGATCTNDGVCADRCFQDNSDKFPGGFCSIGEWQCNDKDLVGGGKANVCIGN